MRIVVFRLVKRRNRISKQGSGARGRSSRYSSSNRRSNSAFTAFSLADTAGPLKSWNARFCAPAPRVVKQSLRKCGLSLGRTLVPTILVELLGLVIGEIFCLVGEHLLGRVMDALAGLQRNFAIKVIF